MRLVVGADLRRRRFRGTLADFLEVGARDDLARRLDRSAGRRAGRGRLLMPAFCSASSWSIRRSSTCRLAEAACSGAKARCWASRKLIWWTVISSLFTLAAVWFAALSFFLSRPTRTVAITATRAPGLASRWPGRRQGTGEEQASSVAISLVASVPLRHWNRTRQCMTGLSRPGGACKAPGAELWAQPCAATPKRGSPLRRLGAPSASTTSA